MQGNKTILHIEDNLENRILIRRILQSEDFQVLEAADAGEAMNILTSNHPNLILMDINMPDMDGYTLTSRLKSLPGLNRTPILAITANVMKGDREKALKAGCDGYIEKPIDIDEFLAQVHQFTKE